MLGYVGHSLQSAMIIDEEVWKKSEDSNHDAIENQGHSRWRSRLDEWSEHSGEFVIASTKAKHSIKGQAKKKVGSFDLETKKKNK